jgi:putative ABC transport system permease protein
MDRLLRITIHSIKAVRAFKLRTLFCLTSVALGIASITIIVAATEGAYKKALDLVAMFGPDSLLVLGGGEQQRAIGQRKSPLTLDDAKAVQQAFPTAYLIVPMTTNSEVSVTYKNNKYQTRVIGSTADYSRAWNWPVIQGSDFTEADLETLKNVGLIGQYLSQELFGEEDPIGKYILVKRIPVQIVGVLEARGTAPTGENLDDRIVMPLTTVMTKIRNDPRYINLFRIRFDDQDNLYRHVEQLRLFLRARHGILQDEPEDFRIISPKEIIKFLVAITGSLVAFLGITGIIALLVAGFVLANLFLLSVQERTREIGIRRSVGARKRDILLQFLGESVVITTAGGVLGFVLGWVASRLLMLLADFPIYFSWKAFAIGLFLSFLIGIGFGLQPASRAANLKPIEAIRT